MNNQGNDRQVQNTNNSSITSKWSASKRGYFTDQFLEHFIDKPRYRSSIINRGYHVRSVNMEHSLKSTIKQLANYENSQIISLGAGFDTSYFRLKSQNLLNNIKYIEVDFEPVMICKREIILNTPNLRNLLDDFKSESSNNTNILLQSNNYIMISANLNNVKELETILKTIEINFTIPTILLSECVLNYLDTKCSDRLISWVASTFTNSVFIVYDQINPLDGFGTIMMNHFATIGTPLGSIYVYPQIPDQMKRYNDLGWSHSAAQDVSETYNSFSEDEFNRINSLEMFDEYEEFDLLSSHYCLVVSRQGKMAGNLSFISHSTLKIKENLLVDFYTFPHSIEKFGHSAALISNNKIAVIGGFGPNSKGHHERLKGLTICDLKTDFKTETQNDEDIDSKLGSRMFSGLVTTSDGSLIVIGGRANPHSDSYKTIIKLSHNLNKWTAETLEISNFDSSFFPLWRHSCTYHKPSGKILVYGGIRNQNETSNRLFLLDLQENEWQIGENTDQARHSHSAVIWKNLLLISGGRSSKRSLSLLQTYDLSSNKWNIISTTPTLKPRYSHTSHIVGDNHLLLLGGVVSTEFYLSTVNLKTGHCQNFALPDHTLTMYPVLSIRHSSFIIEDNEECIKILTLGGGGNCFSFGTHFDKNSSITIAKCNLK